MLQPTKRMRSHCPMTNKILIVNAVGKDEGAYWNPQKAVARLHEPPGYEKTYPCPGS